MLKSRQLYIVPPRYKKSSHWNIEKIKKQNQTQKQAFVDDELIQMVDKSCSGKFSRMIKRKQIKRYKNQQDILSEDRKTFDSEKVFQRSFYKEKKKSSDKEHYLAETRIKIMEKCGFKKPIQPIPFFPISNKNLRGLQKRSMSLQIDKKLITATRIFKKVKQHPYSYISERMSNQVFDQKRSSTEIVNFSPFDNIQPIQRQHENDLD